MTDPTREALAKLVEFSETNTNATEWRAAFSAARAALAAQPAPAYVPLTQDEVWESDAIMECNAHIGAPVLELLRLVNAVEKLVVERMGSRP